MGLHRRDLQSASDQNTNAGNGGNVIKHSVYLAVRPLLARDSRDAGRAGGSPADIEIRMYANLCEVAPEVIEALHLGDYLRLQKCFEGLL